MFRLVRGCFLSFCIAALAQPAWADPVDLTNLGTGPGTNFVDTDGFFDTLGLVTLDSPAAGDVTLAEDFFGFSFYVNDPVAFGHDVLVMEGDMVSFDFDAIVGAGTNVDTFSMRIFDTATGLTVGGLERTETTTTSDSVMWDLTGVGAGLTLGIEFGVFGDFFGGDIALTSTLVLSDLDVTSPSTGPGPQPGPVPEPATAALVALGGAVVAVRRRRRRA